MTNLGKLLENLKAATRRARSPTPLARRDLSFRRSLKVRGSCITAL